MTKQEFETLMKNGHITNTYAHKYLNDEEALKNLTVRDLFNMGLVTVTGLKMEESIKVEETTVAPVIADDTTVAPVIADDVTSALTEPTEADKTEEKVEETTVEPTVEPKEEDIVVDDGEDEE